MNRSTVDDGERMPCEEPGCSESVRVEWTNLPSGLVLRGRETSRAERRRVAMYLRCPAGHVHRYEVLQPDG